MGLHRMMPPGNAPNGVATTIITGGRTYTCAVGSTIDVPDFDGLVLAANGWIITESGGAGPTSARPKTPDKNNRFHDTTLGYIIVHDGKSWRNPATGVAV